MFFQFFFVVFFPADFGSLEVIPLHRHPKLKDSCADLLNKEWSRSKTARLHSLSKSCDALPCSLVLVTSSSTDGNPGRVIGHSMLSQVIAMEDACFIESVLVDPQLRGKGLGRRIMEASEDYAASLGYVTVYLSTHDKQGFYGHLGYEFCEPISKLDSCTKLLPAGLRQQLGTCSLAKQKQVSSSEDKNSIKNTIRTNSNNKNNSIISHPASKVPLPPANVPPPPPANVPLPPPPPPPPISVTLPKVVIMDPGNIFWMKKELHKK